MAKKWYRVKGNVSSKESSKVKEVQFYSGYDRSEAISVFIANENKGFGIRLTMLLVGG